MKGDAQIHRETHRQQSDLINLLLISKVYTDIQTEVQAGRRFLKPHIF
jgi:hypothetical protein